MVYLAESVRKKIIWQNLPDEWLSCKILAEKWLSFKILKQGKEFVQVELHLNWLELSNLLKLFFLENYFQYSCLVDLIKEHEIF